MNFTNKKRNKKLKLQNNSFFSGRKILHGRMQKYRALPGGQSSGFSPLRVFLFTCIFVASLNFEQRAKK